MTAPPQPGQQPSPQQLAMMQQQIAMEAQKRGMTPQEFQAAQRRQLEDDARKAGLTFEQYIQRLKQQAFEQHQRQQQQQQQMAHQHTDQAPGQPQIQGQQPGQQVPINPGPPDPKALAVAKWLRGQDLKNRTCILNGQRKDMFRVKRALRALQSPAYTKAASKKDSPLPPPPTTPQAASELFKLLPLSLLALRVSKSDPHAGHNHAPPPKQKRIKGLWTVKIEQQQDIAEDLHYVWLYEGPQWRTKLYALGALVLIMTCVMFPLWPMTLRIGVWYLSMAFLGLIGLFFAMAIVRLILFCATLMTMPRGLWLYPNLFEDVGFFDSFRPIWGWQEEKAKKGKKSKSASTPKSSNKSKKSKKSSDAPAPAASPSPSASTPASASATTATPVSRTGATSPGGGGSASKRHVAPRVEEVFDE